MADKKEKKEDIKEDIENSGENKDSVVDTVEIKAEDFKAMQKEISDLTEKLSIAQVVSQKDKSRLDEIGNFSNRLQADFDNYKRRTTEAAKKLKEDGMVAVIEKVVPSLDIIEKALTMIDDDKIAEGVKMIHRQLSDMLSSFGVTLIPALGEQFDPNFHNAITKVDAASPEQENTIVEVFQNGYKLGDRVIRHSSVIVAN